MFGITQRPKLAIGLYAYFGGVRTLPFEQRNGNAGGEREQAGSAARPVVWRLNGRVKERLRVAQG
jgi:hypothetical protein